MRRVLSLTLFALLGSTASAQNIVVNDAFAGMYAESVGSSALYPAAGAFLAPFPHLFPLPAPPFIPGPAGGMSVDGATGLVWHSNGLFIAAEPHGAYAPGFGAPPIPPAPVPAVLGGPLTGLAIDSAAGILWITDGFVVAGVGAVPGLPPAVPPFVPGFAGAGPLGGLEFDPLTGTLWAVDIAGVAFNFFPGGAPVGPPLPPPLGLPGPASGIAIDKSGAAIAPMRSLYVVAGGMVADYATGVPFPSFSLSGVENGISYSPEPSILPPGGVCPCAGTPYGLALTGPMTIANPAWSVDVVGLAPGTFVIYALDFFPFNPALPTINSVGCAFGLNFASAFGLGAVAGPTGVASLPLPLTLAPVGAVFYMQHILACPTDPVLPVVISPLHQIAVSAP